jgi:hypothetical protein
MALAMARAYARWESSVLQRAVRIDGLLAPCSCGRQPKHYHSPGKDLHFLECAPCGVTTRRYSSFQLAVDEWEASHRIEELKA